MANKVNKIQPEVLHDIKKKSALALPNNPSASGLSPNALKQAFSGFVVDSTKSSLAEQDRIVNEINAIFSKLFVGVYEVLPTDLSNYEVDDKIILTNGYIYKFDGEKLIKTNLEVDEIKSTLNSLVDEGIVDGILKTDIENKLNTMFNEKEQEYAPRLTNLEINKADKAALQAVASGSPKGVFPTLAALQAAYPTGDNSIYVVTADGHWYYWNGSAWTDGGVYMSSISSQDVAYIKNSFGGLDYFVNSGEEHGYYDTSGVFQSNSSFTCSKFPSYNIFEINFTNIANVIAEVILFDKNNNVISYHGTSVGSYSIKIPNNCYYIAINFFGATYTNGFTVRSFRSANRDEVNDYLSDLTNGKVRVVSYNDVSVYRNALTNNGSITASNETSITFSYPATNIFNGIIFGVNNGINVPIDDNLDRTFIFEFDAEKTSSYIKFRVDDNNDTTLCEVNIQEGHNKIAFNLNVSTSSFKYIYFIDSNVDNVAKTLKISNVVVYQGNSKINIDLYNLLYQLEHKDSGKIKMLSYKDPNVYTRSQVLNGTKTNTSSSVTFTYVPTDFFNGVIFGVSATAVTISNDFTKNLFLEFDATFDSSKVVVRLLDTNNNGVAFTIANGHNKIKFNQSKIENGVKYIFFDDWSGASTEKTLLVENIELYQGDENVDPYIHELIAEVAKDLPEYEYPFEGKKILTIGDSLTNSAGDGLHWQTFVTSYFKMSTYLTAGGAGYTIANRTENSIYSHVMALTADADVEIITLWGGTNDWGEGVPLGDFDTQKVAATRDNTTFLGGLFDCVEKILTLYPTKSLMLVGTTQRILNYATGVDSNSDSATSGGHKLEDFVEAVRKVAEYYSLPFLDLYHCSNINKYSIPTYMFPQTRDDVTYYLHFSGTGQAHVGKKMIEFIKTNFE